MKAQFHIAQRSANGKTGLMLVTTSGASTCPPACPFRRSGCYGDSGPLRLHWDLVSNGRRGISETEYLQILSRMTPNQIWRLNQVGDLPGKNNRLNKQSVIRLSASVSHTRPIAFTHYPVIADKVLQVSENVAQYNRSVLLEARQHGLSVNISANNLRHADQIADLGLFPVVATVPKDSPIKMRTPEGRATVRCPATVRNDITCSTCGNGSPLCSRPDRAVIVTFPAHGNQWREVDSISKLRNIS